jgi:hypothetical protein
MSKKTFYVLMAVSMVCIPVFSAQERVVKVQNSVRFGYDDNIYQDDTDEESAFITDILNITGKFNISGRTDAVLFWQPEVRYRFDGDPETVSYQDLYASLNHAMSQRTFLTISDRLRYQMKDGRSGNVSQDDQNYLENELNAAVDFDLDEVSLIKVGGGYTLRRWDDDFYGEDLGNDFDRFLVNGSYIRRLNQNKTAGVLSVSYVDQQYDGSRDGYQATTLNGGVDQTFNPNLSGFGRVGASFSSVDNASGSSDNTSPYLDAGLTYKPSERTSIDGSVGYSIYYSENSIYNAQDEFNARLGVRHDLTSKIGIASSIAYIFSMYDSDYAYRETFFVSPGDGEEHFVRFNIRATYQINRNNFVEAGYEYNHRDTDSDFLPDDYDRNVVDIGWRLRL